MILLTDAASAVPAVIQPSGQTTLVSGDNSFAPRIDFLEKRELVRPGDRVISSGDGEVFPPGLLIGQVASDRNGQLRVRLSADFERLEFLRVMRHHGTQRIDDPGEVVGPSLPGPAAMVDDTGDSEEES